MFSTRNRITVAIAVTTTTAALFAAGCSDDDSSMPGMDHGSSSSSPATSGKPAARSDFNDADVTFLQMMYPHHAQAVEMARLVPSRTQNEQLRALAGDVEQAQAPEMEQITTLLQSFGKPAPSAGGHNMEMPGMTTTPSTANMPGMMSNDQMNALAAASGADFDRQWMEMMIEHHTGAIAMANTELANGANPDARALATAIIAAQQAEIATMRGLLGQR
ncbi:DUF305 domain-containing protein [Nocardia sp. NBC_00565]|uniref:DUF305 domain-containing protein n=1 Tax=Nocardia sp. NBC_00565 TaxID=2975993 RepID=UPI002E8119FE|nr:DUF305 domain-containing protein [Nocardia sp. NBC_00565]WUC00835.1 DUF305 domain-containing protein [Nocardia sp. NBC_00565]